MVIFLFNGRFFGIRLVSNGVLVVFGVSMLVFLFLLFFREVVRSLLFLLLWVFLFIMVLFMCFLDMLRFLVFWLIWMWFVVVVFGEWVFLLVVMVFVSLVMWRKSWLLFRVRSFIRWLLRFLVCEIIIVSVCVGEVGWYVVNRWWKGVYWGES